MNKISKTIIWKWVFFFISWEKYACWSQFPSFGPTQVVKCNKIVHRIGVRKVATGRRVVNGKPLEVGCRTTISTVISFRAHFSNYELKWTGRQSTKFIIDGIFCSNSGSLFRASELCQYNFCRHSRTKDKKNCASLHEERRFEKVMKIIKSIYFH